MDIISIVFLYLPLSSSSWVTGIALLHIGCCRHPLDSYIAFKPVKTHNRVKHTIHSFIHSSSSCHQILTHWICIWITDDMISLSTRPLFDTSNKAFIQVLFQCIYNGNTYTISPSLASSFPFLNRSCRGLSWIDGRLMLLWLPFMSCRFAAAVTLYRHIYL